MIKEEEFRQYLTERGNDSGQVDAAVNSVKESMSYFAGRGLSYESADVDDFKEYIRHLMKEGKNTEETIMGVARYVYFMDMKEEWIYFASIIGGRNILPSIKERLASVVSDEASEKVFSLVEAPPLGCGPEAYPEVTKKLMDQLRKELSPEVYKKILAGNHHRVSVESFARHKGWLEELGSVDAWLEKMHSEIVTELEHFMNEGKVWYEQVITLEVVEYVKADQERLSGRRDGEWIYNTKFPYSPREYLLETDPLMKRYYMCHCPLARESVLSGEPDIPMDWCYCSAGYGKLRYDIAFGTDTEAEVLESVFSGSDKCRFRFKIPEEWR
ncbi:MAG: hypothetical protein NWE89_04150 [Candidatus Bathyarchaeota archaeon]|nr:hypothetical protein [Candidatus Bathyarchaeota archaeon]